MKNIIILGSTGSIGRSTLEVIRAFKDRFRVIALAVRENIKILEKQIKEFSPRYVAILDFNAAEKLKNKITNIKILTGEEGIKSLIELKNIDIIVNAIIGSPGLRYTYEAVKKGKTIALANKESLVMAGKIIMRTARRYKSTIVPIDSEHSALFHLLQDRKQNEIERIILTASGGPFLYWRKIDLRNVTPWEALRHPVWRMGDKITVDSATMINKGFEVIEAHHLFNIEYDKIDVIIHPQSIIHSMVQTIDGEIYAQLSPPDMKYPILNALAYPEKLKNPFQRLSLEKIKKFTFERPDYKKFPLLKYAYEIGKRGGNLPAALTVADDIAVKLFLQRKIKFNHIFKTIKNIVESIKFIENPDIKDIFDTENYILQNF